LKSGCIYQYIDYVVYFAYECSWLNFSSILQILKKAFVLALLSLKMTFPEAKLKLDEDLCSVLMNESIFNSIDLQNFEEEIDEISGKIVLDGFFMLPENQTHASYFEKIFKALEHLLTEQGMT